MVSNINSNRSNITTTYLEITPSGIKRARKDLREQIENFKNDFSLIKFVVWGELHSRVFDKSLGILWLLLETLILAGLYYLLTKVIFKTDVAENQFLFILVSLIFWRWFSKTVDNSPTAITGYGSVLKQTNFPVHLVILIFMGLEFTLFLFGFFVLVLFLLFFGIYPSAVYIYLPIIIFTQFVFTFPLVLIFSVIGTFFKDFSGILYAFTSIWWYLSPGIYPVSQIPQKYLWIYNLNPFAHILPAYRDILIYGKAPNLIPIMFILIISLILSIFAVIIFNKSKYHFYMYL